MANLILSRKAGESIVIGEEGDIVVTIQSVRGGTVDVRIAAPRDVPVHRDEIYAKLHPDSVPEAVASGEAAAERARKPRVFLRRRHRQSDNSQNGGNKSVYDPPADSGAGNDDGDVNGNR